ncbi:FAD:protein FMN transferase [Undibacterium sp. LX15W]|uniref:FAD:protein FMN transferase n=2 Tax=Undibacterium flavidum TaxID=2762297 RepID=A0ABR6Y946_9BURK|nr:FAD:protein FMN transferase [Undibacterium flavidum]
MGSRCECRLTATTESQAFIFAQMVMNEVGRIEHKYSRYRNDSILSQINQQAGLKAVNIDQETSELLDYADVLFRSSDGLFDISSGILRRAWNFSNPVLPAPSLIESLLDKVGWNKIERDRQHIYLPIPEMEIDFGGFGKEYAADRVAALLLNAGVRHGLIDLGGDLRILGPQTNGDAWQIGIQNPRDTEQLIATIPIHSGALATSGDYERFFDIDGQRYCHILDPRTGYPVRHWQSVSVLAPLSIAAGSYSTIAMLKQDAAQAWLAESGLAYLLVDALGQIQQHNSQTSVA